MFFLFLFFATIALIPLSARKKAAEKVHLVVGVELGYEHVAGRNNLFFRTPSKYVTNRTFYITCFIYLVRVKK